MESTVANTYNSGHGNEYAKHTGDGSVYTYITGHGNNVIELKAVGFDTIKNETQARLLVRLEKGSGYDFGFVIENAARREVKVGDVIYCRPESLPNLDGFREWAAEQLEIRQSAAKASWARILEEEGIDDDD